MVGVVIFTLSKFKELNQKLDNLEKMLNDKGHGGRG